MAAAEQIVVVHPRGRALPDSFLRHDFTIDSKEHWRVPSCLTIVGMRCQAVLLDLDGDGGVEVLLFSFSGRVRRGVGGAFKAAPDGGWGWLGPIPRVHCAPLLDGLEPDRFEVIEPRMKDIDIGGTRLRVADMQLGCPVSGPRR